MNEHKAAKIIRMCLDELYRNSDPPITWEECEKKYKGVERWFQKHTISVDKYNEIVSKYREKLPRMYQDALSWELVNYGPKTVQ